MSALHRSRAWTSPRMPILIIAPNLRREEPPNAFFLSAHYNHMKHKHHVMFSPLPVPLPFSRFQRERKTGEEKCSEINRNAKRIRIENQINAIANVCRSIRARPKRCSLRCSIYISLFWLPLKPLQCYFNCEKKIYKYMKS